MGMSGFYGLIVFAGIGITIVLLFLFLGYIMSRPAPSKNAAWRCRKCSTLNPVNQKVCSCCGGHRPLAWLNEEL